MKQQSIVASIPDDNPFDDGFIQGKHYGPFAPPAYAATQPDAAAEYARGFATARRFAAPVVNCRYGCLMQPSGYSCLRCGSRSVSVIHAAAMRIARTRPSLSGVTS